MVKPMANLEDSAPPTGNETILICEDNDAVRQVAVRFLEGAGYAVLAAASGAEAQRLMSERTEPIDLLVTDVVMADTNGRRLADALAGTCPGLKTLFISGYTANVISHHGVLDEGVEFLEKPFTRAAFLQRVREVLDKQPNAAQK